MISKTAISFDFWNTLYADGAENNRMARRKEVFKNEISAYQAVTDLQIDRAFDISFKHFLSEWRGKMRTPTAEERISLMASHLQVDLPRDKQTYLAEEFGRLITDIPPLEIKGAKKTIQSLAKDYPLGIISDTGFIAGRHIRAFLKNEGILQYFRSFLFSDEQDHSKPHQSVFEKTAEQLDVPLQGLIHIGDLERTDILGAVNAGCMCIKFTGANHRSSEQSVARHVVHTYESVRHAVNALVRNSPERE